MKKKHSKPNLTLAGLAAGGLISGCVENADVKQWEASPGTTGFINLDAVKEAFQKNGDMAIFEDKVNEIFEGDNMVIFKMTEGKAGGFSLFAYEDLNENGDVDSATDDLLFSLEVKSGKATLAGQGLNKYYKEVWDYNPETYAETEKTESTHNNRHHTSRHRSHFIPFFYRSRGWGGYHTPREGFREASSKRDAFRQTSGFTDQVSQNKSFEKKMASKYGSGFRKSVSGTTSPARKAYISQQKKTSRFAQSLSNTKSKSAWGQRAKSSSSSSFAQSRPTSRSSSSSSSRSSFKGSSGFGV